MSKTGSAAVASVMLLALFAGEAAAFTGNEYRALTPLARLAYVVGVVDGWDMVSATSRTIEGSMPGWFGVYTDVLECMRSKGMSNGQVHAIVEKYVRENPANWHARGSELVALAMHEACKP